VWHFGSINHKVKKIFLINDLSLFEITHIKKCLREKGKIAFKSLQWQFHDKTVALAVKGKLLSFLRQ
jgi:hypothetical protein